MKTATLPSLRVEPELRQAAESVLREGESLSGFVEAAVRTQIRQRQTRQAFIARGLAARDAARETGEYFSAEAVLSELDVLLAQKPE
ncbi:MAG: prevent-host-death protein [Hydrogenophilales bacterium RIFOXYD1_FULL_62_11]|nr:MAG: prevent-host-death protein [Hydrogenophilales bacterium RIFOXYD1_FULL_62_11]